MIKTQNYIEHLEDALHRGINPHSVTALANGVDNSGYAIYPLNDDKAKKNNIFRALATNITLDGEKDNILRISSSNSIAEFVDPATRLIIEEDLNENKIPFDQYKLAKILKVSTDLLADKEFPVIDHLDNEIAKKVCRAEEKSIINGAGNTIEPKGLLNLELDGVTSASITYHSIINLFFSLDEYYRHNASFIVNDNTLLKLMNLTDEAGNLLYNRTNNTILNKPVYVSNYMPDDKPILFGDFTYLWILYREPIKVKRLGEFYEVQGEVGFEVKERLDFKLIDSNAVKVLILNSQEESED